MNEYDRFWEFVYGARRYLQLLLFCLLFLLVLSGIALVFGQSKPASATMLQLDVALIFGLGAIVAGTYWYSVRRYARR